MSGEAILEGGRCDVCGHEGAYVRADLPTRENFRCRACQGSLRYRLQARAIASVLGRPGRPLRRLAGEPVFLDLDVYEPGLIGPFRPLLGHLPGYRASYYWPGVDPGRPHQGIECQDLRSLTFPDASFDLVISSDIFEHVRGPMEAFAEIARVLRPGGHHVFTVPVRWPLPSKTVARVDWSGPEDVFLLPAEYHGSPVDPRGSLVYTDFGMDLPEDLRAFGLETATHHGYKHAVTFVSSKPAPC